MKGIDASTQALMAPSEQAKDAMDNPAFYSSANILQTNSKE